MHQLYQQWASNPTCLLQHLVELTEGQKACMVAWQVDTMAQEEAF